MSAPPGAISVTIVSWRVPDLLRGCLRSLVPQLVGDDEVIVIDNASGDGTAELVRGEFPQVRFVQNTENRHYAPAMNQAVRLAHNPLVLVLNPDTVAGPDLLAATRDLFGKEPRLGALGYQVLNPDGSLQSFGREQPGVLQTVLSWFAPDALARRFFDPSAGNTARAHERPEVEVDSLSGCAFAVRRSVVVEQGLFDESLPVYAEDIDLFARLRDAGLRLICTRRAAVVHFGGASFAMAPESRGTAYLGQLAYHLGRGEGRRLLAVLLGWALTLRAGAWRLLGALRIRNAAQTTAITRSYLAARARVRRVAAEVGERR